MLGASGAYVQLLHPSENAYLWQRTDVLRALLIAYGAALLGLAIWIHVLTRRGRPLGTVLSRHFAEVRWLLRQAFFVISWRAVIAPRQLRVLLIVLCLGVVVRGYFLSQPMRYDEANTFLNFVNGNLLQLFFYPFPNNHVLHTIFVKLSTAVLGASPQTIRLPAFLAGIVLIPLVFCVGRALLRGRSAAFAALALAVCPYLILYSTNARGYTLMIFFTLLLVLVGVAAAAAPSKAAAIVLSALAALGFLTVPSMAFPVAGVYLWLTCLWFMRGNTIRDILRNFVVPVALLTVAFTAILYTPVIFVSKGIDALVDNRYVAARPSDLFFHQLPRHLGQTLVDFSRDIPGPLLFACAALMLVGFYRAIRRRDWPMLLLLPAALVGSAVLLLFKHAIPFPRTWIFLLPLSLILANAGWVYLLDKFSVGVRLRVHRGFVFAGVCYAVWLMATNAIARYPDTGAFPEAAEVARYLRPIMNEGDKVRAAIPADYPLYFYLWYYDARDYRGEPAADEAEFVIVQKNNYDFETPIDTPMVKLADMGEAAVYQAAPDHPASERTPDGE